MYLRTKFDISSILIQLFDFDRYKAISKT